MRIEVICTGDEVLTGKIVNSNFSLISQKLEDVGLAVQWETTVGDDRADLLLAFQLAGARADAVIVNGGLGPTVDDLSQEIAAQAAGVGLELHEEWMETMQTFFSRRGRNMPPNNRKQAMLPVGSEMIDNPIGTACGFAVTIGKGRFFFTPGVPRELRRMLDEQIVPRLTAKAGVPGVIRLKRLHTYGIGESHADALLEGVEDIAPGRAVKLGFRAHYPQLETKLTVRAGSEAEVNALLGPVEAEVRKRLGNFILAEDDASHESVVLDALAKQGATLALAEMATGGIVASRLLAQPAGAGILLQSIVAPRAQAMGAALGREMALAANFDREVAGIAAKALREKTGATHALAVLTLSDDGPDRMDFGATVFLALDCAQGTASRVSRVSGGRDWVRTGAAEMALDVLRRFLHGLPVEERNDFERPASARR